MAGSNLWESLYNQTPPPAVTGTTSAIQGVPNWYQDYQKALLKYTASALPTAPTLYGGNRLADLSNPAVAAQVQGSFSPQEQQAFGEISGMQGNWQPGVQTGMDLTTGAGANPTYNTVGQYMSPYISNVNDALAAQAARNLKENLLPQISDTFVGAGQMQGTRQGEFTSRALRDSQTALLEQQAQNLNQGYQGALTAAQADAQRALTAGQQAANLAGQAQGYGLTDAAALAGIGQQVSSKAQAGADIGYQNFVEQRDWPLRNIGALTAVLSGTQPQYATTAYQTQPVNTQTGTAPLSYLASGATQVAGLPYGRAGGRVRQMPRRGALQLAA